MQVTRSPGEVRAEIGRVQSASSWLDRCLWAVAAGALVFTMATVTEFAMTHGTPWFIAWLLDPLCSIALLAVLLGDGVLARYGIRLGGWATLLKWVAGAGTWTMNIWASVAEADVAGVVLHSLPPALVILLAEVAPRFRVRFAHAITDLEREYQAAGALDRPTTVAPAAIPTPEPVSPVVDRAPVPPPAEVKRGRDRQVEITDDLVAEGRRLDAELGRAGYRRLRDELGLPESVARKLRERLDIPDAIPFDPHQVVPIRRDQLEPAAAAGG